MTRVFAHARVLIPFLWMRCCTNANDPLVVVLIGILANQVQIVLEHKTDDRVVWYGDDEFRLIIGKVVGGNSEQTRSGRRQRLRVALDGLLAPYGWEQMNINRYHRIGSAVAR